MKASILHSRGVRCGLASLLCALVAAAAAIGNARGFSLLPPSFKSQSLQIAGASAQAMVDVPGGNAVLRGGKQANFNYLTDRTALLGQLSSTPPVLGYIARRAGIVPTQLSGTTSVIAGLNEEQLNPDLERRANQIVASRAPYHLDFEPDPALPRFEIYARAPTPLEAARLADAAVPGLRDYLRTDAIADGVDPANQLRIEQSGPARAGALNSHATVEIIGLTFVVTFAVSAALLLLAARIWRGWKFAATRARSGERSGEPRLTVLHVETGNGDPSRVHSGALKLRRNLIRSRQAQSWTTGRRGFGDDRPATGDGAAAPDDWPHTTRILPWMIAGFLFVLWLIPFNLIQIGHSGLPIDLRLDRVLMPFLVVVWVLALVIGGRMAPRLQLTWVHAGVFLFGALAFLSVVIDARYLSETLALDQGIKRLALLLAYLTFFVMIASAVRRSEVPAFLRYTLVLAVLAAVGTIIEFRFGYNAFDKLAHILFPGFNISSSSPGVDLATGGRKVLSGPADVPLEAVGMFTMALPIALVGLMDASSWRQRSLYGIAAALLLAGTMSTERKSGLLGPLAVIATLAFFRRRQLLPLAPLGLIIVVGVKALTPGAIGSVTSQLAPSQLGVGTLDDRVVRYDAIRPDVWLHLAFGQGFGTYTVRVLDNELLGRLVEGGVLGLAAYVLMLMSIVLVAVGPVRRRDPIGAGIGLVAASAAVATLVLSSLYDLIGFPHGPYILLSLAGLLAVAAKSPEHRARTVAKRAPPVLGLAWSS